MKSCVLWNLVYDLNHIGPRESNLELLEQQASGERTYLPGLLKLLKEKTMLLRE